MEWTPRVRSLVERYSELIVTREHRALSPDETEQLTMLRDVILEAGVALESETSRFVRRSARAARHLEVSFRTPTEAAKAMTREIGTGGLALMTKAELPVGASVSLEIKVPVWPRPLRTTGEVVWRKGEAVGLAFRSLDQEQSGLLKDLVAEHASVLDRVRQALMRPQAAEATVNVASNILLLVGNSLLAQATAAILGIRGHHAATSREEHFHPDLLACDAQHLADASAIFPSAPVVVVNASGPDSLMGKLSQLRPRAYVKRPATPQAIADAIRPILRDGN